MYLHPFKFGIVLHRLSLVHRVEIKPGIIVLNWLEVHLGGLSDAAILGQLGGIPSL